jgi:transposase
METTLNLTWINRKGSPADRYDRPGVKPKENVIGTYVGLDVSLKETSVCILRDDGSVVFEGKVATDPAVLARLLRMRASDLIRVGLESGPTSAWLTHALAAEGLPVVCLDARHAQAVLSVRPNKSDPGDARGLAEMVPDQAADRAPFTLRRRYPLKPMMRRSPTSERTMTPAGQ